MNDPLINKLREAGWRRKLTANEEADLRAWLTAHPEAQVDWELEAALNESLGGLQDAPVPANFTARVLQLAEQDSADARRREPKMRWSWHSFLPKAAFAAGALCLGLVLYSQHQATQRANFARKVAAVSEVTAVPDPALLKDFYTIRRLDGPDEELLAVYKLLAASK
jgi:ferric-dicitrate binding protein FerR (iron transport regulator)